MVINQGNGLKSKDNSKVEIPKHPWLQRRLMAVFLRFAVATGAAGAMSMPAEAQADNSAEVDKSPDQAEARLREVISDGFQETTEEMMSRKVGYHNGAKDGVKEIDCSGFVRAAAMNAIGYLTGTEAFYNPRKGQKDFFDTGAGDQIGETARRSKFIIKGIHAVLKAPLKEGMLIAMDTGEHGDWDHGIDHIVLVYRDKKNGQLMVGQSSLGHNGVHAMPLDEWKRKISVYSELKELKAVDVVKLAVAVGATPDEAKLAARQQTAPASKPLALNNP